MSVYNSTKHSCLGEQVRVADTSWSRMRGLLGTDGLSPGQGLFILPSQAIHTIGMTFPIDVVFVDQHYTVVGTREAVRPFRLTRVFWKAIAVIELPAGTIRATRTTQGDTLTIEDRAETVTT